MNRFEDILENRQINQWVKRFRRAPRQINKPHASDAELIEMEGNPADFLAITTDTVSEEITAGIYREPFTMGWVAVMSNFSDLAAVGADPLGMVLSISVESASGEAFCEGVAGGIQSACDRLGVYVLGGDTNIGSAIAIGGCAIGLVPKKEKMTRIGCRPGDRIFLSGPAGIGSALGLVRLTHFPQDAFPESAYRPVARIREGRVLRKFASCCMDTSDGVLATLDQLMRLNQVGFVMDADVHSYLRPDVIHLAQAAHVPAWVMLAGHHGEFELVFAIPPEKVQAFLSEAIGIGWSPIPVGQAVSKTEIKLSWGNGLMAVDTRSIRNCFTQTMGNPEAYVKKLLQTVQFQ